MEVKKVGAESIPIVQSLVTITWPFTYKEILSAAQLSYMLQLIYSAESLQNQIEKQGHQFILGSDDKAAVGFASYGSKNAASPAIFKLHKIYIDPGHQGKGIGKILLDYILHDIKLAGSRELELNVNRHNKALGFYQRFGFKIIDEQDIPIGNGYFMNDYIMRLNW
ncbi:MAG: GNAT family N-acetyltransferase [Ferruginibacter sp.]|nr:GNAT family N-acetyltransferase [Ferruginibacter sp.]